MVNGPGRKADGGVKCTSFVSFNTHNLKVYDSLKYKALFHLICSFWQPRLELGECIIILSFKKEVKDDSLPQIPEL